MTKIMFICHGNICRSPMAEFIMRDMVEKQGRGSEFYIASSATSYEEIGNPVHRGTKAVLDNFGISSKGKRAVHLERSDYNKYDYLVCMDGANIRNALRILGDDPEGKVHKLLEFVGLDADVADPWFTGNFEVTYRDVVKGCRALLQVIDGK